MRCQASPCCAYPRGEHLLVTNKLKQRRRSLTALLEADQTTVAFDRASADEIHQSRWTWRGRRSVSADIARRRHRLRGGLLALVWRKASRCTPRVSEDQRRSPVASMRPVPIRRPAPRGLRGGARRATALDLRQPQPGSPPSGYCGQRRRGVLLLRPMEPNNGIVFR
jgi:hypothetical protein